MAIVDALVTIAVTHSQQAAYAMATPPDGALEQITIWRRPVFHAAISATGCQPSVLIPQATGDLLRYSAPTAGNLIFAGLRTMADRTAPAAICSTKAQCFILPAQRPSSAVPPAQQRLYRGHQQVIVFAAFLTDATALLTADLGGEVSLWPMTDNLSTGLGWFEPLRTMKVATAFVALQLNGPRSKCDPGWDHHEAHTGTWSGHGHSDDSLGALDATAQTPCIDVRLICSPFISHHLIPYMHAHLQLTNPRAFQKVSPRTVAAGAPPWRTWLVRYSHSGKQCLRTVYRTTLPSAPPTPTGRAALPHSWQGAIIETYDCMTQDCLTCLKQALSFVHVQARLVHAALSPCKSSLLLVLAVPAAPQQEQSWPYFRFQIVSLATWRAELPYIDVLDWSRGNAAPVFCFRCAARLEGWVVAAFALRVHVLLQSHSIFCNHTAKDAV
jgi:hypothetical protein